MPRILAIDWDRLEARAVLLHAGPTGNSVVGAWAVPLDAADGATAKGSEVGALLAAAIAGRVSGNMTTLVGVGRDHVQMKLLALPPAPIEELPELVRFQAEREFTALGDGAALDFIPLSGGPTTPHQVLAAALAERGIRDVNELCRSLAVEPDRITLRAAAAASFVARSFPAGGDDVALVANLLTDEADLTAMVGDQVVLVRTVRLPQTGDAEARQTTLAAEIRRTVAVVRQQLGDRAVDKVVICGGSEDTRGAASLADQLELSVEAFDIAGHAPAGLAGSGIAEGRVGRLAAVLGMALGEADRRRPVVDFLNVRARVAPQRFTRIHALAAAAAAIAVVGLVIHLWRQAAAPVHELAAINAELAGLETQGRQYAQVTARAAAVEDWLSSDVNWLDELDRLSHRWRPQLLASKEFPVADDVVITQLSAVSPQSSDSRGGFFELSAVAKSDAAIAPLEARLRDDAHLVRAGSLKRDQTIAGYERAFSVRIEVPPEGDAEDRTP
jgi:hypothetical protein